MSTASNWREHAGTTFATEKTPAAANRGMVVANHPLASAAGAEMLAAGGNAIDAAIAALFTLTIVEPMMVGIMGGGMAHIRLKNGKHVVLDGLSTAPAAAHDTMYKPLDNGVPMSLEVEGRENAVGAKSVASSGALRGWSQALQRYGTMSLADVMEPAIRHAARGFVATRYLSECAAEAGADLIADPAIAAIFMPDGKPLREGQRVVQSAAAQTLRAIAKDGPEAFYNGPIGDIAIAALAKKGGVLAKADLTGYKTIEREAVRDSYRGHEIVGPPPPSSGGVHVIQMLNILGGFDLAKLGFGSTASMHLILEAFKIAFADRAAATADPAFVKVPVDKLISSDYAAERRAEIDPRKAKSWSAGVAPLGSPHTTHVTVADGDGNVVASTQTINSLFGSRIMIPELGLIPNNYMYLFQPRPGRSQSITPGKRVTTSMSPLMVLKDGAMRYAIGLPGGLRIFGSAMQAIVNLLEHGMSLQEAVEAPRVWTQGDVVEVEDGFAPAARHELARLGHKVHVMPHVAGGMNAISFAADGTMTGAACWRADGAPIGVGGGVARTGVRFWPDQPSAKRT